MSKSEMRARVTLPTPAEAGAQRRARLLGNREWLTQQQVDDLLKGARHQHTSQQLRVARRLAGVRIEGVYLYPIVLFDRATGVPWPVTAKLLSILPADMSDWATINWLFQGRRSLGGECPADCLASVPEKVLEAARDDFAPSPTTW